ncbi:hypothetical protein ES707_18784 [subsurface metagenome]
MSSVTVSVPVSVTRVKASTAFLVLPAVTFLLAGELPSPIVIVAATDIVKVASVVSLLTSVLSAVASVIAPWRVLVRVAPVAIS